ncbi:MAG: NADH-ubiquinone oxidoreductase-F iron-sulfur binding region domain-containing protein [Acidimicrobiales bacterium]
MTTSAVLPDCPIPTFDHYLAGELALKGLERAVQLGPEAIIEEVTRSGLRGRGGAGFPTGRKWRTVADQRQGSRYLVCNAAEGEPSTFKDRLLLQRNPYQLIEGLLIAALAIDAHGIYIGLKARHTDEYDRLVAAIAEMQQAGVCRDWPISVVRGPEDYLFGEERALLEVIEGRDPLPRLFPPYERGLFATDIRTGWENSPAPARSEGTAVRLGPPGAAPTGANPTVVNNVETLCHVAAIMAHGAAWFRGSGTERSPGSLVVTVVGDVVRPGVAELPMGTSLADAIGWIGGGAQPGRAIKAVLPGVSAGVIPAGLLSVALTYEDLSDIGSGLGAAGFWVLGEDACMVEVARQVSAFLAVQSCGQCPPCKQGSIEITALLDRLEAGVAQTAELRQLDAWLAQVTDANRCYLGTQEQQVVASLLSRFPDEVKDHLTLGRCPRPRPLTLPVNLRLASGSDPAGAGVPPLLGAGLDAGLAPNAPG